MAWLQIVARRAVSMVAIFPYDPVKSITCFHFMDSGSTPLAMAPLEVTIVGVVTLFTSPWITIIRRPSLATHSFPFVQICWSFVSCVDEPKKRLAAVRMLSLVRNPTLGMAVGVVLLVGKLSDPFSSLTGNLAARFLNSVRASLEFVIVNFPSPGTWMTIWGISFQRAS